MSEERHAHAGDERPLRLLARTPVDEAHQRRLADIVAAGEALAAADKRELQYEFGKEAVAAIVGCNQFVRLYRAGTHPGRVELWLDGEAKAALAAAGHTLLEPEGTVFKLFGWVAVEPMEGDLAALEAAVSAAYRRAAATA